jgi:hypothetical protein
MAAVVEHVDPHLLDRPAQALAEQQRAELAQVRNEAAGGHAEQRAVLGLEHRGVGKLVRRVVGQVGALREVLAEPANQVRIERAGHAQQRNRKQAEGFGHRDRGIGDAQFCLRRVTMP